MKTVPQFDLAVIGGGINGTGIARDAAGRGLSVLLVEQADLASGTSSASTKLIHGGLRYLEYYDFGLVRESLREREVLLRSAPHIIWPMRFVLPHHPALRPAWLIRAGLFLYDHLGGRRRLPASKSIDLARDPAGAVLKDDYSRAFEYSDCWAEDSRLVVLNAVDARDRGAAILTRTRCISARREADHWRVQLTAAGEERTITARSIVNAAGPWVPEVDAAVERESSGRSVRLVKGSHLVTRRLFEGERAFFFQNDDRRLAFAIPYEKHFTLIGTTERRIDGNPADAVINDAEVGYLLDLVNDYLREPVRRDDIVATFAGVRPLLDEAGKNASAVTRDYVLDIDDEGAPLLTVYGGKLTTFRHLAAAAMERLAPLLGAPGGDWTLTATLPGGDLPDADFEAFHAEMTQRYAWMDADHVYRLCRAYGTRIERVIGRASAMTDLGRHFGAGLSEAELEFLLAEEFAATAEDVLWRRSKLGLHLDESARAAVGTWMGDASARRSGALRSA